MSFQTVEDNRRIIYDWGGDPSISSKVVIVKDELPIGDHWHEKKTEVFFLVQGLIKEAKIGAEVLNNITSPFKITVLPGTYHQFICTPGTILLCNADQPYDPADEIRK